MPGLVAPLVDEREVLLAFLGQQRDAFRYAAHGLDGAGPPRPTVSELSLAGLVKHAALTERGWTTFLTTGDTGAFVPPGRLGGRLPGDGQGESVHDVLAFAAGQARSTERVVGELDDLTGAPGAHRRPRPVDTGRDRLDAALGPAAPH